MDQTADQKEKSRPGQKSDDPKINKYDEKVYTTAINATVNMYDKNERRNYYIGAQKEWSGLCHDNKVADTCFLLGEFYRNPAFAGPIGFYSPQKALQTFTDCCHELKWASCCKAMSESFLYNRGIDKKNYFSGKQNLLYALEGLRKSCLEQDYSTVGGKRPSDFKAMYAAGEACGILFRFVEDLQKRDQIEIKTGPTELQKISRSDLDAHLIQMSQPENLLKNCPISPDLQKIQKMLYQTPPSVFISQGCKMNDADMCHILFKAKMNSLYGFAKDVEGAYEAGETSCRKNHYKSCFNLWKMYEKGIGRPPNPYKAQVFKDNYLELSGLKKRRGLSDGPQPTTRQINEQKEKIGNSPKRDRSDNFIRD